MSQVKDRVQQMLKTPKGREELREALNQAGVFSLPVVAPLAQGGLVRAFGGDQDSSALAGAGTGQLVGGLFGRSVAKGLSRNPTLPALGGAGLGQLAGGGLGQLVGKKREEDKQETNKPQLIQGLAAASLPAIATVQQHQDYKRYMAMLDRLPEMSPEQMQREAQGGGVLLAGPAKSPSVQTAASLLGAGHSGSHVEFILPRRRGQRAAETVIAGSLGKDPKKFNEFVREMYLSDYGTGRKSTEDYIRSRAGTLKWTLSDATGGILLNPKKKITPEQSKAMMKAMAHEGRATYSNGRGMTAGLTSIFLPRELHPRAGEVKLDCNQLHSCSTFPAKIRAYAGFKNENTGNNLPKDFLRDPDLKAVGIVNRKAMQQQALKPYLTRMGVGLAATGLAGYGANRLVRAIQRFGHPTPTEETPQGRG